MPLANIPNNENEPSIPTAKTALLLALVPARVPLPSPAASTLKRKSLDQQPVAELDICVEDLPIDQNCDQVRRKIVRFLDAGEMTKTAFAKELGVRMKSLTNFLAEHGAHKGSGSASYDQAFYFFKERELRGIKITNKAQLAKKQKVTAKAAAAAKAPVAAVATGPTATPAAVTTTITSPAPTSAPAAPAAKKGAFPFGNSSGLDLSTVTLDGEDTDTVLIFDSCDEVRRKINVHMKNPGVTQAQFCRDILAQMKAPKKPNNIQGSQLARFRGMNGPEAGAASVVFYGAYVFFEKIRIKEGKPKSKHRLVMEKMWGPEGFERESSGG